MAAVRARTLSFKSVWCLSLFCLNFSQASSSIVGAWGAVRQALGSLAEDKALAQALAKSVSALEGVQSTDQDICQVNETSVGILCSSYLYFILKSRLLVFVLFRCCQI